MAPPVRRNRRSSNGKPENTEGYTVHDLPALKRKKTTALNRLIKTEEIGTQALSDSSQLDLFMAYYSEIKRTKCSFDDANTHLLNLQAISDDNAEASQSQCDDIYYKIIAIHRKLQPDETVSGLSIGTGNVKKSNIKLPKINLVQFSGSDLKSWPTFIDSFNNLIHHNESLNDIERMMYLHSCLNGDALSLINTYPAMGKYYLEAYNTLVDRYKNKRDLAFQCWKEILNINLKVNSPQEYRKVLDLFSENLSILKTLDLPVQHWDFVLTYLLLSKLDAKTRCDFEEFNTDHELPSFTLLKEFLYSRCEAQVRDSHFRETASSATKSSSSHSSWHKIQPKFNKTFTTSLVSQETPNPNPMTFKCSFCQEGHSINNCTSFLAKSIKEREEYAKQNHWCFNCLKGSHQLKECKSFFRCQKCKQKHHTLLHVDAEINVTSLSSSSDTEVFTDPNINVLTNITCSSSIVLLSTARVQVLDSKGNFQTLRALIDSGSQAHFISDSAALKLGFKPSPPSRNVCGLGQSTSRVSGRVLCSVGVDNKVHFKIDVFTLPSICGVMPSARLDKTSWQHLKNLKLADPDCDIPGPVDMLIGAEVFMNILLPGRVEGNFNEPSAMNSIFGWLLLGRTNFKTSSDTFLCSLLSTSEGNVLNEEIKKMWELDSLPFVSTATQDEILCEEKYKAGLKRDTTGRYAVPLPFKTEERPEFPGSRDIALRRLHSLERRLFRNPELYQSYKDFLTDYFESRHMSRVPIEDIGRGKYYIPHHCVVRPDSETTKTRVVFDASATCANGTSLNDTLLIGEKLQGNIIRVLLRFRLHEVVFIADMKQMFRQVDILPNDRDYQRILWRLTPNEPVQEYRLNTVTYGTSAAPFLACRTIKQLVTDEGAFYPLAAKALSLDLYVDDVTTGASSLRLAQQVKTEIVQLLRKGGIELRKWASNDAELLSDIQPEDCLHGAASFDDDSISFKVLGLKWKADNFIFKTAPLDRPCTKRNILSEVARIFDPLGFLSPITFSAKRLLQKLWIYGTGWDELPPEDVLCQWNEYNEQLHLLDKVEIPRKVTVPNAKNYQLHGFSDGSEAGYGAVVYLRVVNNNNKILTSLLCAKSRVAPLKCQSIPRLELCGAVLLADLIQCVRDIYSTEIPICEVLAWSDSTVVLAWIKSHCSRWKTFVANRVSHIQQILPACCWNHVPTDQNPADVSSRGALPEALIKNMLWWSGPRWLSRPSEYWPNAAIPDSDREEVVKSEERSTVLLINQPLHIFELLLENNSSFNKVIRILAYCLRFIRNIRTPGTKKIGSLSSIEQNAARISVVKHVQYRQFSTEIDNLKNHKLLSKPFRKLNPFIDEDGVLRVGGRLARSGLAYEHKHPALLPRKHRLTEIIVRSIHEEHCHPGINTTHYLIVQNFWILSPKRAIRAYLSKCVRCYRTNPKALEPFMSDLPAARLNVVKPFSIVGVDFGGPFTIKVGKHRGAKTNKAYLCLFVCFTTKAVHLEVVSDLSTEAFVASLRRFVARRGRCNIIHSDCGTNFIGAKNQLLGLMQNAVERCKLEFRFNPPSAPHFGGIWEIQIKAAKALLYRTIGSQVLTFEELTTLFTQIESVLNSRPLCPLSSDPNDINVLTPGHFLTMEPLTTIPDEDLTNVKLYRLNRWQLLQQIHQAFWKRWQAEYLNTLTQRAKWTVTSKPLMINSVVIIKEGDSMPLHWPLARVVELHASPDGIVRQATVKTAKGTLLKRPLVKLCPLPDKCD